MEPERSSTTNWLWIIALAMMLVLFVSAAMAHAGTATVRYREPDEIDLKECRFFLRNAAHAVVADKTVAASSASGGQERTTAVEIFFDLNVVEGQKGDMLARCVDVAGNVSVDSIPFEFTFPVIPPRPPAVLDVQIAN